MNKDIQKLINDHKKELPKSDKQLLKKHIKIDKEVNRQLSELNDLLDSCESIKLSNNINIIKIFQKINV